MLLAKIHDITFEHDDDNQTVSLRKLGDMVSATGRERFESYITIADNKNDAIKMLRKELQELINSSLSLLSNIDRCKPIDYKYFRFSIATAEIKNNKCDISSWYGYGEDYPLIGDVL